MLFNFFNRGPNAKELARVFQLFTQKTVEWGMQQLEKDKKSEDLLVCFSMAATGDTIGSYLREIDGVESCIGGILQQTRAYYECLWQLNLLSQSKTPQDRDKVSKLYCLVDFRTRVTSKAFFNTYPEVLKCGFDETYDAPLRRACDEYINGRRETPLHSTQGPILDNAWAYSLKVMRTAKLPRSSFEAVLKIAIEATARALSLKFLTQFDFANCNPIVIPDSWLKK